MPADLETLLKLRREAERVAQAELARAAAGRMRAETEQARLDEAWRAARAAARAEAMPAPVTAGMAVRRDRFREQLDRRVNQAARRAEAHRREHCLPAEQAELAAQAAHERARLAREAVEQLAQRAMALAARTARRRAESTADDRALAAHRRRHEER